MDEFVFSLGSRAFALAGATQALEGAQVLVTYAAFDPDQGTALAHHRLQAAADQMGELLQAHQASYPMAVLNTEEDEPSGLVEMSAKVLTACSSPEAFAFEAFPRGTILGPGVIRDGRLTMRAVLPAGMDLPRIHSIVQQCNQDLGAQNGHSWEGFQIHRINGYDSALSVEAALAEDLTPKQLEVVRTALALGYYESPRRITLHHISELYGISKAAAHNRLQAAERKIIMGYFQ